jgi:hypothetical protein
MRARSGGAVVRAIRCPRMACRRSTCRRASREATPPDTSSTRPSEPARVPPLDRTSALRRRHRAGGPFRRPCTHPSSRPAGARASRLHRDDRRRHRGRLLPREIESVFMRGAVTPSRLQRPIRHALQAGVAGSSTAHSTRRKRTRPGGVQRRDGSALTATSQTTRPPLRTSLRRSRAADKHPCKPAASPHDSGFGLGRVPSEPLDIVRLDG